MVYAVVSKTTSRKAVRVRLPPSAHFLIWNHQIMPEKLHLQPVTALTIEFDQSLQWTRFGKQPTTEEYADEAANQSFLTFEQTEDGKILFVLRGQGMDILHQERDKEALLDLYEKRLMFWLERSLRNTIINIQIGRFRATEPEYLEHCEDFYSTVFIENQPTDVLLHRMLDADQISAHDHILHDASLTLNR